MINESQARKYCREDITLIKNYAEAIADATQTWICHHRNAEPFTGFCTKDLKKMNMYYQRPASELMFVTRSEHKTIHNKGTTQSEETRKKLSNSHRGKASPFKGKHHSEESRKKLSESHTCKVGKHHSEDTRKKMSAALKGRTFSDETRNKMSESHKCNKALTGRRWYNNGLKNVATFECPVGFVEGRIRKESR